MKRLSYTKEMKLQDLLWRTEEEDLDVMEELFKTIVLEAKAKGFKGVVDIYVMNNEVIADVYESEEEKEEVYENEYNTTCYGFCKPLIKHLEELIN